MFEITRSSPKVLAAMIARGSMGEIAATGADTVLFTLATTDSEPRSMIDPRYPEHTTDCPSCVVNIE